MKHIIPKSGAIALFAVGLIIFSPTNTYAAQFDDVDQGHDYYEAIQWMADRGIEGYENGNFGVWDDVMRGQSAKFFSKALDLTLVNQEKVGSYFNDIDTNTGHAKYIATAAEEEVFTGDEHRNFLNLETLSREQMASTIVNAFELEGKDNQVDINLDNVTTVHQNSVQILADHGITDRIGDFEPRKAINRGQFSAMLMRADNVEKPDNIPPKLTYEGEKEIIVGYGKAFELPEVTATDNKDKNIEVTSVIKNADGQKLESINTEKPGTYTVTYGATDDAGNAAEELKITVIVNEPASVEPEMKYETEYYNYDLSLLTSKQMKLRARPQTDANFKWYDASRRLTEYYANPNNFEKGTGAFYQFLKLNKSTQVSTIQLNQQILSGKGILEGKGEAFRRASDSLDINEIYLVSHALHETGNGTSELAKGVGVGMDNAGDLKLATPSNSSDLEEIKTVYNFFGIGAHDADPVKAGAKKAYKKGWDSPKKAIEGGAEFAAKKYIYKGQDTLFKMRWNPDQPGEHQYATDVGWAVKQTDKYQRIYNNYEEFNDNGGLTMTFEVPKFLNQPGATDKPTGVDVFHVDKEIDEAGTTARVNTDGIDLNLRKGPTTNFSILKELPDDKEVTIIGENANWYKVTVDQQEGWVSGEYLQFDDEKNKKNSSID